MKAIQMGLIYLCFSALALSCGGKHSDLLSDGLVSTTCASSTCAVVDSNAYLSLKRTSTYYAKKSDLTVEVNGECFVADSKSHSISLSVKTGTILLSVPYRGLNIGSPDSTSLQCAQGKFSVILDISNLAVGVYNLSGQLNLVKPDGSASSPGTGSFIANISISN